MNSSQGGAARTSGCWKSNGLRKTSAFVLALAILLLTLACGQQPRIAFHSDRDGNWEIYVMNADGSDQTRLTDYSASHAGPDWSP